MTAFFTLATEQGRNYISSKMITDYCNENYKLDITPQKVGKILVSLKLLTQKRRVKGVQQHYINWEPSTMRKIHRRYMADKEDFRQLFADRPSYAKESDRAAHGLRSMRISDITLVVSSLMQVAETNGTEHVKMSQVSSFMMQSFGVEMPLHQVSDILTAVGVITRVDHNNRYIIWDRKSMTQLKETYVGEGQRDNPSLSLSRDMCDVSTVNDDKYKPVAKSCRQGRATLGGKELSN